MQPHSFVAIHVILSLSPTQVEQLSVTDERMNILCTRYPIISLPKNSAVRYQTERHDMTETLLKVTFSPNARTATISQRSF